MRSIAILGATSQIAGDLILNLSKCHEDQIYLYGRRLPELKAWLAVNGLHDWCSVAGYDAFHKGQYDVIVNFVGAGCPMQIKKMGTSILEVTDYFDSMAVDYLKKNENCRYIFVSSGAVHNQLLRQISNNDGSGNLSHGHLEDKNWYALSKIYAEKRHRFLESLPIVDIRIFSYFSRNQKINAHFLASDILRSLHNGTELIVSNDITVRDYLHPEDFSQLIDLFVRGEEINDAVDCYSCAPIEKIQLLEGIKKVFGLKYSVQRQNYEGKNREKSYYYSSNHRAEMFGYFPKWSSLNGVISEISLSLDR